MQHRVWTQIESVPSRGEPKNVGEPVAVFEGSLRNCRKVLEDCTNRYSPQGEREIPITNEIQSYFHCGFCLKEQPADQSPMEFQRIQAGWTPQGFQVWCIRHDVNIVHVDFEGFKHPGNVVAAPPSNVGAQNIATCVGCGCTDDNECPGGCSWTMVDWPRHIGVCSNCDTEENRNHYLKERSKRIKKAN